MRDASEWGLCCRYSDSVPGARGGRAEAVECRRAEVVGAEVAALVFVVELFLLMRLCCRCWWRLVVE